MEEEGWGTEEEEEQVEKIETFEEVVDVERSSAAPPRSHRSHCWFRSLADHCSRTHCYFCCCCCPMNFRFHSHTLAPFLQLIRSS